MFDAKNISRQARYVYAKFGSLFCTSNGCYTAKCDINTKNITTFEAKCNDFLTRNQLHILDAKKN